MSFLTTLHAVIDEETFGFGAEAPRVLPLAPGIGVVSHTHFLPLPRSLGSLFLKAGLFSRDGDFTHTWTRKAGHENRSWLRQVWTGESRSHHTRARFWTVLDGETPVGVALLETSDETEKAGRTEWLEAGALSVYLLPAYRGKGIMKAVVDSHVAPFIADRAEDACRLQARVFAGAEDAAGTLLEGALAKAGIDCPVLPVHHAGAVRTAALGALGQGRKPKSP
jgi:GNAT superfamily N-acetyltransferase